MSNPHPQRPNPYHQYTAPNLPPTGGQRNTNDVNIIPQQQQRGGGGYGGLVNQQQHSQHPALHNQQHHHEPQNWDARGGSRAGGDYYNDASQGTSFSYPLHHHQSYQQQQQQPPGHNRQPMMPHSHQPHQQQIPSNPPHQYSATQYPTHTTTSSSSTPVRQPYTNTAHINNTNTPYGSSSSPSFNNNSNYYNTINTTPMRNPTTTQYNINSNGASSSSNSSTTPQSFLGSVRRYDDDFGSRGAHHHQQQPEQYNHNHRPHTPSAQDQHRQQPHAIGAVHMTTVTIGGGGSRRGGDSRGTSDSHHNNTTPSFSLTGLPHTYTTPLSSSLPGSSSSAVAPLNRFTSSAPVATTPTPAVLPISPYSSSSVVSSPPAIPVTGVATTRTTPIDVGSLLYPAPAPTPDIVEDTTPQSEESKRAALKPSFQPYMLAPNLAAYTRNNNSLGTTALDLQSVNVNPLPTDDLTPSMPPSLVTPPSMNNTTTTTTGVESRGGAVPQTNDEGVRKTSRRARDDDGDPQHSHLLNNGADNDIDALFPSLGNSSASSSNSADDDHGNENTELRTNRHQRHRRRHRRRQELNPFTGHNQGNRYYDIMEHRKRLPVYKLRHRITRAIIAYQVVILSGETGSGKSTQVPQFAAMDAIPRLARLRTLYPHIYSNASTTFDDQQNDNSFSRSGYGTGGGRGGDARGGRGGRQNQNNRITPHSNTLGYVACTQPRKITAITLGKRVATEAGVAVGNEVGYHVRFDNKTSRRHLLFTPTGEQSTASHLEDMEGVVNINRSGTQQQHAVRSHWEIEDGEDDEDIDNDGNEADEENEDDSNINALLGLAEREGDVGSTDHLSDTNTNNNHSPPPSSYLIPSKPSQRGERTAGGIVFYTDGVLVREFLSDPIIQHIKVVIVDEVHERSVDTDLLLGLLKDLIKPVASPPQPATTRSYRQKRRQKKLDRLKRVRVGSRLNENDNEDDNDDGISPRTNIDDDNIKHKNKKSIVWKPHPYYPGCFCKRPDLRIVIMSATMQRDMFVNYFTFTNPLVALRKVGQPPPREGGMGSPMLGCCVLSNPVGQQQRRRGGGGDGGSSTPTYALPNNIFNGMGTLLPVEQRGVSTTTAPTTHSAATTLAPINQAPIVPTTQSEEEQEQQQQLMLEPEEGLKERIAASKVKPFSLDVHGTSYGSYVAYSTIPVENHVESAAKKAVQFHVEELVGRERRAQARREARKARSLNAAPTNIGSNSNMVDSGVISLNATSKDTKASSSSSSSSDSDDDDSNPIGYSNGDILIFLPGERDVLDCCKLITRMLSEKAAEVEEILKEHGRVAAHRRELERIKEEGKGIKRQRLDDEDNNNSSDNEDDEQRHRRLINNNNRNSVMNDSGVGVEALGKKLSKKERRNIKERSRSDIMNSIPDHLKPYALAPAAAVLPLFGSQSQQEQSKALLPAKRFLSSTTHNLRRQSHHHHSSQSSFPIPGRHPHNNNNNRSTASCAHAGGGGGGGLTMPVSVESLSLGSRAGLVRKIICATNIAESSITIQGVSYVIDSGLYKQAKHHSALGVNTIGLAPISKASMVQRSGRANRTSPGYVFRLYTKEAALKMKSHTDPEIRCAETTSIVLMLAQLGFVPFYTFPFITPPFAQSASEAWRKLVVFGAIRQQSFLDNLCTSSDEDDDDEDEEDSDDSSLSSLSSSDDGRGYSHGNSVVGSAPAPSAHVSKIGRQMGSLPVSIEYGKAIVAAAEYGCVFDMVACIAMIECGASQPGPNIVSYHNRNHNNNGSSSSAGFYTSDRSSVDGNDQNVLRGPFTGAGFMKRGLNFFHSDKLSIEDVRRKWFLEELIHPDGGHLTLATILIRFIRSNRSAKWCDEMFLNVDMLTQAHRIMMGLLQQIKRLGLPTESLLTPIITYRSQKHKDPRNYHDVLGEYGCDHIIDTCASGGLFTGTESPPPQQQRQRRLPHYRNNRRCRDNPFHYGGPLLPSIGDDGTIPPLTSSSPFATFSHYPEMITMGNAVKPIDNPTIFVGGKEYLRRRTPMCSYLSDSVYRALLEQRASVGFRLALLEGLHEQVACRPQGFIKFTLVHCKNSTSAASAATDSASSTTTGTTTTTKQNNILELELPPGVLNHLERREWGAKIPSSQTHSRYAYYLDYHVGENDEELFGGSSWVMYDKLDIVVTTTSRGDTATLQPRLLTRIDDPAWLVRVWKTGFGTTSGASNTHTQYDTQAPKVEAPLSDERRAVAASLEPEVISKAVRKTLRLY